MILNIRNIVLVFSFSLFFSGVLFADKAPVQSMDLHECTDNQFGIQFLCNPDWELEAHPETLLIIISSDPAITLTISKAKSPVIFFDQLTDTALQEMGQYADGFRKENVKVAGEDAIKVLGYSVNYPEIRLMDFYFLHDLELYSILFSVNPKMEFLNYEALFNSIITSIKFLNK